MRVFNPAEGVGEVKASVNSAILRLVYDPKPRELAMARVKSR